MSKLSPPELWVEVTPKEYLRIGQVTASGQFVGDDDVVFPSDYAGHGIVYSDPRRKKSSLDIDPFTCRLDALEFIRTSRDDPSFVIVLSDKRTRVTFVLEDIEVTDRPFGACDYRIVIRGYVKGEVAIHTPNTD